MSQVRNFKLPIAIRQTAATAAASVVWAMRNLGGRVIAVRRVGVNAMFDGTAAASSSQYQLARFRTATPTAGAALTVVKANTDDGATTVTDARVLDTGLTPGAMTFDAAMCSMGAPRQVGACAQYVWEWSPGDPQAPAARPLLIKPQDGLCILVGVTAVIGDGLQGMIEWDEFGGAQG